MGQLSALSDQAASLREWANEQAQNRNVAYTAPEPAPVTAVHRAQRQLIVAGLKGNNAACQDTVKARLQQWSDAGYRWVGDPADWDIVLWRPGQETINGCKRWAIWVGSDLSAFNQCFATLKSLAPLQLTGKILALHEPGISGKGLLNNLCSLADEWLDMKVVHLAAP